jgi:DNA-binding transcriptional MerR regulator
MTYSISDLEQLSGISVHNIRIWERRYKAFQPLRTAGNTRFYDDDQLKRLLNIAALYYAGYKISKACAMSKEETEGFLQRKIDENVSSENQFEYFITQIISKGLEYNESEVSALLSQSFQKNGILETYKFVLYPLLVRLGLMWQRESLCPSQEHFLSSIFRQKMFSAIDSIAPAATSSNSWLLFLPEDEDHELGLLLANYMLKSSDNKVVYLGPKVPLFALKNTIAAVSPKNLLYFMTRVRPIKDAQAYVDQLSSSFPEQQIYVSGNRKVLSELQLSPKVKWLREPHDFEKLISQTPFASNA